MLGHRIPAKRPGRGNRFAMSQIGAARFRALLWKEIREHRWPAAGVAIILILLAVAIPPLYPFLTGMIKNIQFEEQLRQLPWQLRGQLEATIGSFEGYAYSNWFKNLYQLGMILVLLIGAPLVASELAFGTIDFLASKPVTHG